MNNFSTPDPTVNKFKSVPGRHRSLHVVKATKRGCVGKGIQRKTLPNLRADGEESAVATPIRIGISQRKKEEDRFWLDTF